MDSVPSRKEIEVVLFRLIKWVLRLFARRTIPGLSGKSLSSIATGLLGEEGAQLPGLLSKLTTGGLGDTVQSWVGKGKNQALSADQVRSALDSKTLSSIAAKLGTSEDVAASKVAGALPKLIDRLTPEGEVPDQETIGKRLAELLKK